MEESEIEDRKRIVVLVGRLKLIMADAIRIRSLPKKEKTAFIDEVNEIKKELQTLQEKYKNV